MFWISKALMNSWKNSVEITIPNFFPSPKLQKVLTSSTAVANKSLFSPRGTITSWVGFHGSLPGWMLSALSFLFFSISSWRVDQPIKLKIFSTEQSSSKNRENSNEWWEWTWLNSLSSILVKITWCIPSEAQWLIADILTMVYKLQPACLPTPILVFEGSAGPSNWMRVVSSE